MKAENIAMRAWGLTVAPVLPASSPSKDVVMIERFDRVENHAPCLSRKRR